MTGFVLRRLLQLPFILLAIYTIAFVLVWVVPGNPFEAAEGRRPPRRCRRRCARSTGSTTP